MTFLSCPLLRDQVLRREKERLEPLGSLQAAGLVRHGYVNGSGYDSSHSLSVIKTLEDVRSR